MLQDEILIFDDLVPEVYQDNLNDLMPHHSWKLKSTQGGTSGINNEEVISKKYKNIYEQYQFSSVALMEGKIFHDCDNIVHKLLVIPNLSLATKNLHLDINQIKRIKLNLQTKSYYPSKGKYNFPHIDYNNENIKNSYTILYYLNDSDGDTYFFNEKIPHWPNFTDDDIHNLTIRKQIPPKKGRIVMFRSDIMHAGSHPIENDSRMVVNYNLYPIKLGEHNFTSP